MTELVRDGAGAPAQATCGHRPHFAFCQEPKLLDSLSSYQLFLLSELKKGDEIAQLGSKISVCVCVCTVLCSLMCLG